MKHFFRVGRELSYGQSDHVNMLSRSKFGTQTCYQDLSSRPKEESNRLRDRLLRFTRSDDRVGRNVSSLIIIFCVLFSWSLVSPAFGQEAKGLNQTVLTGVVSSIQDGKPIEGASVTVDKKHARTDKHGRFTISVDKPTGVLTIKHIGYKEQRVAYENTSTLLKISLLSSDNILDEAVVIGYGVTTRRLSTGSVTKVGGELLDRQPLSNPILALQGLVPGLDISPTNGINGSPINLKIRGNNSLTQGSEPLVILDGNPIVTEGQDMSIVGNAASGISILNQLNASDIESIEVLKDADATSIYGSRGANGVILITTKRGSVDGMQIDFSINSGISTPGNSLNFLNTEEYFMLREEALRNSGLKVDEVNAPDLIYWNKNDYTDFGKQLKGAKNATTTMNLNLAGGNDKTSFRIGAGRFGEAFQIQNDKNSKRTTVSLDLKHKAYNNKLEISFVTNYASSTSDLTVYDPSSFLYLPPNAQLYKENGDLNWTLGPVDFSGLGLINPYAQLANSYNGSFSTMFSNLSADYIILPGLTAKLSSGYTTNRGDEYAMYLSAGINPSTSVRPSARSGMSRGRNWIVEPQVNYRFGLAKGTGTLLLGGSLQQRDDEATYLTGMEYADDLFLGNIASAGRILPNYSESKYKYAAVFGRIGYQLTSRYLVNLSVRRDGSSRFGANRRYAGFYSIGAAWIFSDEPFFRPLKDIIGYGKIRGSYGTSGNDQIGNYKFMDIWTTGTERYEGVLPANPNALYNADYAWERSTKREVALDLGFLNERLFLSASYFRNLSSNQLIQYKLPSQTGFSTVNRNLDANILNTGTELSLEGSVLKKVNFSWHMRLGVTVLNNRLLEFPNLESSSYAARWEIGEPINVRKLYRYTGIDQQTGVYTFEDSNADGVLNDKDRNVLVSYNPDYFGGLNNTLQYKSLQLGFMFDFKKQKGDSYLANLTAVPGYGISNYPTLILDRWQRPGDDAQLQRFAASVADPAFAAMRNFKNSDGSVSNASFIRLRNVSVSYRFSLGCKSAIRSVDVFANAQNLKTWTDYIGADPEIQQIYTTPPMKTVVFGAKLSF